MASSPRCNVRRAPSRKQTIFQCCLDRPIRPRCLPTRPNTKAFYEDYKAGQLDMGLLFNCFQADLEAGFITVQKRLNGESLEEYIKPTGGGYYFALPGIADASHYLGQTMLEAAASAA